MVQANTWDGNCERLGSQLLSNQKQWWMNKGKKDILWANVAIRQADFKIEN